MPSRQCVQWFTPDKTMEPVFGIERQKCFGMSKHLKEHLTNPYKKKASDGKVSSSEEVLKVNWNL